MTTDEKDVFIQIQCSVVSSKALILVNCLNTFFHDCRLPWPERELVRKTVSVLSKKKKKDGSLLRSSDSQLFKNVGFSFNASSRSKAMTFCSSRSL